MTTKRSETVTTAKKKLHERIAAAQKHADAAKKEAKLAKLSFRTAKQAYKDARRAAKKLRKGVKKLKAELAALAVKRRKPAARKVAAAKPEPKRPLALATPQSASEESSPAPVETSPAAVDRPPVDPAT